MSFFLHEINYRGEFQKKKKSETHRERTTECMGEKKTREVLKPRLD